MANRTDEPAGDGELCSPEMSLGFLLSQAAGIVREHSAEALKPVGVSPRSLGLLLALRDRPGSSQTELSRRLRIDRSTMSQLVEELSRTNVVTRTAATDDRRHNQLVLTPRGEELLRKASALALIAEQSTTAHVDADRIANLKRILLDLCNQGPSQLPRQTNNSGDEI